MPTNIGKVKQDIAVLDEEIKSLQARMKKFPEGELYCENNGKYVKYYIKKNDKKTYMTKNNRDAVGVLAQKKYYSNRLIDAKEERKILARCADGYGRKVNHVDNMFERHPQLYDLIAGCNGQDSWAYEDYERCDKNPEQLIIKTISGNVVRSKSEAIIDSVLSGKNISFRYEAALEIGGITLYPDFTIKHPYTGEIIYWEHFGMMDNQAYSRNTVTKLSTYISCGIIPSINLITTYETGRNPLSFDMVKKTVEMYFDI